MRIGSPWWLVTLAVVGALAITTVIISLFFSLGRRPSHTRQTMTHFVGSEEFLMAIAGLAGAPLRQGGTFQLLNNGDEFFPALISAIRSAKRTINISVYIWEPGQISDLVFTALIERAQEGVEVRVLLDGLGCLSTPKDRIAELNAAGGKVATFREPRFGKLTRLHQRNHRRAIVIDGTVAFTGGAAISDKWLGHAQDPKHWRDTMLLMTGPPALTIQSAFAAPWVYSGGELLVGSQYFPENLDTAPTPDQEAPIHVGIASSPASENHALRLFFLQTFLSAREKLYITTPYFVPDRVTREAVAERASRGVDVRILLPNEHTDALPIRLTSHCYYQALLESGVRIYEYQPSMLHSKGVVVDGMWSVMGSANMDIRSTELNGENVIGILDQGFARQMEETFLKDLEQSREIRLWEWRKRSAFTRLLERGAGLFAEQY